MSTITTTFAVDTIISDDIEKLTNVMNLGKMYLTTECCSVYITDLYNKLFDKLNNPETMIVEMIEEISIMSSHDFCIIIGILNRANTEYENIAEHV